MTEQKRNNTKNSNNLSIIEYLKNKNSYPAIDLVRNNPEKAAMISKLVGSTNPVVNMVKRNNSGYLMSDNKLLEMSNVIKNRLTDNENIMQLFPDIELCAQILTSSILSPKDMVKTELIFNLKNYILPPSVSTKLLEKLKKYLNEEYDLEKKIPSILREALFDVGCYATAIIPEASVDSIINRNQNISIESLTEIFKDNSGELVSLGFLGNIEEPKNKNTNSIISLESFTFNKKINNFKSSFLIEESRDIGISLKRKIKTIGDNGKTISFEDIKEEYIEDIFSFIKITDNYNCLKLPSIIKHNNSLKTKQIIKSHKKFGMEAYDLTDKDIESLIYKNPKTKMLPIVNIKTDDSNKRKSIGKPLLAKLPSESIIPVYKPGNPNEHVAYFILIDEEGGFVSRASAMKSMNTFSNQVSNVAQPITSFLLTKARRNLIGPDDNNIGLDRIGTIYSTIVEKELIARIKNGTGGDVELGNNEEVYRIMLARTLANQFTRLLYIPAELVSYITFNYHLNGTGKGLLDDLKIIVSNRAILLFSEIMATSKNSIAQTKVNVTFDPNDPDPQKTADMIIDEVIRTRGNYYPLGVSAPIDLVDWVQRAGIMFAFEGHPGFPQTKLDFEAIRLEHTVPDSDLKENLRKQMYMHFGLSPETVDNGFNSEFATTEVAHNILFAKRTAQYQDIFTNQIEDYLKKIIDNDFNLLDELAVIIKESLPEIKELLDIKNKENKTNSSAIYNKEIDDGSLIRYLLKEFILNLKVSLPKPDITTLENQSTAFNQYSEALDKALTEAFIDGSIVTTDISGTIANDIEAIKAGVKALFLRKWISDNNYMPELNDLVTTNDDGKATINLYETLSSHLEGLIKTSSEFVKSIHKAKLKSDKILEDIGGGEESTNTPSNSDTSSNSDEFGSDFEISEPSEEPIKEETGFTPEEKPEEESTEEESSEESSDKEKKKKDEEKDKTRTTAF